MTWARWYWPLWIVLMFGVTFLIPEIWALTHEKDGDDNTLSNWVWMNLDVPKAQQLPWTAAHYLVFGMWLTLVSWLTFHFFFRRFV